MNILAKFFSSVVHPLLMPTYIFAFVFYVNPDLVSPIRTEAFVPLLSMIFIATFLLPVVSVIVLYKMGVVGEVNIESREERFIPQAFSSLIYLGTTWVFYTKLSPVPFIYIVLGCMTLCMIVVTLVNRYWKISAHSTAVGGLFALFAYCYMLSSTIQMFYIMLIVIVLAGVVMASRLFLNVHNLGQVCAGFMLGTIIGIVGMSSLL